MCHPDAARPDRIDILPDTIISIRVLGVVMKGIAILSEVSE